MANNATTQHQQKDYRAFVFAAHPNHGMLLLHCTRKPKKGNHFQLPGGHLDDSEFESAATHTPPPPPPPPPSRSSTPSSSASTPSQQRQYATLLLLASQIGAARELYEETGIDVRSQLERLVPAPLRRRRTTDEIMAEVEVCSVKDRCYFNLVLMDDDFPKVCMSGCVRTEWCLMIQNSCLYRVSSLVYKLGTAYMDP